MGICGSTKNQKSNTNEKKAVLTRNQTEFEGKLQIFYIYFFLSYKTL